jgi:hypothetical protein
LAGVDVPLVGVAEGVAGAVLRAGADDVAVGGNVDGVVAAVREPGVARG